MTTFTHTQLMIRPAVTSSAQFFSLVQAWGYEEIPAKSTAFFAGEFARTDAEHMIYEIDSFLHNRQPAPDLNANDVILPNGKSCIIALLRFLYC